MILLNKFPHRRRHCLRCRTKKRVAIKRCKAFSKGLAVAECLQMRLKRILAETGLATVLCTAGQHLMLIDERIDCLKLS